MATAVEDRPSETSIIAVVEANPVSVLTDRKTFNRFYEEMKAECDAHEPDLTTEKGRKAIASLAYKVARTKTAIDDAGKKLNEEWRARINAVDEARREIRQQLDELKDEVRRPLTEWEEKEEDRKRRCTTTLANLQTAATVALGETSGQVENRRSRIAALVIDDEEFAGFAEKARAYQEQALDALAAAAERLRQEERDRAELERLRKEREERAAREAEEARKREEEEARQRAEAERERLAKEAEERRQREIAEAEERARREAEEQARAEERRIAEEKLAEERRQREAAEREAAEARRKEQERLAWEEKERRERERREANERHRKAVIAEIAEDLAHEMGAETDNRHALSLTLATALAANLIRNVTVNF